MIWKGWIGIAAVCMAADKDNFKALIEKGIFESIPDLTSWRTQDSSTTSHLPLSGYRNCHGFFCW
jgi:hypothetical protein